MSRGFLYERWGVMTENGAQLVLRDEGASGSRHYLSDQAVHAGSFLQVLGPELAQLS